MNSKGILNELRKEMDEIKQKPLNKPEVCIMSWNEKYQLDNTILCLQEENKKLKKVIELLEPKSINTLQLRYSKNVEEYNEWASKYYQLTPEEYKILKEYLNDK